MVNGRMQDKYPASNHPQSFMSLSIASDWREEARSILHRAINNYVAVYDEISDEMHAFDAETHRN